MSLHDEQGLDDAARKALGLVSDAAELEQEESALQLLTWVWDRLPQDHEELVIALAKETRGLRRRLTATERAEIEALIDLVNELL